MDMKEFTCYYQSFFALPSESSCSISSSSITSYSESQPDTESSFTIISSPSERISFSS